MFALTAANLLCPHCHTSCVLGTTLNVFLDVDAPLATKAISLYIYIYRYIISVVIGDWPFFPSCIFWTFAVRVLTKALLGSVQRRSARKKELDNLDNLSFAVKHTRKLLVMLTSALEENLAERRHLFLLFQGI